jgi:hypothetical protein
MRGQPDCDQTADEQQVQDKDDAQAGLQESRRMLSRPLRLRRLSDPGGRRAVERLRVRLTSSTSNTVA